MDKIAEVSGMRFGVEIETVRISRKDTGLAILAVVDGEIQSEAAVITSRAVSPRMAENGASFQMSFDSLKGLPLFFNLVFQMERLETLKNGPSFEVKSSWIFGNVLER